MPTNGYTGQLQGPFAANEDLYAKMKEQMCLTLVNVFKIGIFSKVGHFVNINGQSFELGKTGILEVRDTDITSLYFEQDETLDSFIDYMYIGIAEAE